ncbi:MAG TPA: Ku protein [Tahibacter sp.]|nr:Ku protein [Tahibacter sp.]
MARPIWNGTLSFGLLQVPVQLMPGERSVDLHFRLLDRRTKDPIRYERVNSETGEEVPWKEVVKAYEYAKGSYAVVDEQDLKAAAPESTETIDVEAFVDADAVDPRYFEKPYVLVPGKRAEKGYVLLRQTLKKSGKAGIARLVIRTRQYLAMVKPHDDALVVLLMRFPQELVDVDDYALPKGAAASHRVSAREVEMAGKLVESMTVPWNPADYRDDFRAKLRKIVEASVKKKSGGKLPKRAHAAEAPEPATNVVDFTALLRKSLASGKRTKPAAQDEGGTAKKKPRRAAAKKTTTRRRSKAG